MFNGMDGAALRSGLRGSGADLSRRANIKTLSAMGCLLRMKLCVEKYLLFEFKLFKNLKAFVSLERLYYAAVRDKTAAYGHASPKF